MDQPREHYIERVREFNRFYTNMIEILDQSVLKSGFSLAEARVLFEMRRMKSCSAREIRKEITIDEGYLSRILNKFVAKGLVTKVQSKRDKRRYYLELTSRGAKKMAFLDALTISSTEKWIDNLTGAELSSLLSSMQNITQLLTQIKR